MKVLVVGGGVAGICLSHELREVNCEVVLIDNGKNVSSTVAAGIINPIVFRRMTLSWRVSDFIPFATKKYLELEQKTNTSFFHPLVIRRLFPSIQELNFWKQKQDLPEYSDYMETLSNEDMEFPNPQNTFGTARVKQASFIDAKAFITANKAYFNSQEIILEETFNYDELDPEKATYKGVQYDFILFAEGKDASYNPLFSYLPLQLTKGEVLTIHSETIDSKESLNRKCFLLPIGDSKFKVGSTYVWDTDNTIPTQEGLETITENLKSINSESYIVEEHCAGVRPTVLDRRPLLGKHPKFPKMVIANGLGAKGYMLAPLLMHELVKHLFEDLEIPRDSHICRFESLMNS